jgi:choline dehydrogenase-like flavoprotein
MPSKITQPEYDVVIIGSGVAGALVAHQLSSKGVRVLILEAGGVVPESLGRYELLNSYVSSAAKASDAPFCGDNLLANQPDPRNQTAKDTNYYYYPPGYTGDPFKSFYERLVGGSLWHWQGIYVRMLPTDFTMKSTFGVKDSVDWPIRYHDVEPYYVRAERAMGVAGAREDYHHPRFRNPMSRPYPMPELAPSFLDRQLAKAVDGHTLDARMKDAGGSGEKEPISLRVTPVPHAINSVSYDGRPACDGRTSCVPLCTIKARYEAVVHIEKALRAGAILRKQAVVSRLQLDDAGRRVIGVHYVTWYWKEEKDQPGKRAKIAEEYATGRIMILAANGIENPMILLRSKAAPSSKDVLGAYLMDHPIKQSYGIANDPLYPFRGPQTTSQIEGFRDGKFRKVYAAFKTSLKNDGWSTSAGWPRGGTPPAPPEDDWHPGSIVHFVQGRGYAGAKLRDQLAKHAVRQITLNSACEQLPIKENRISAAPEKDELDIERPEVSYRVFENDDGYIRRSFQKIIELHGRVFDLMGIPAERRKMLDKDKFGLFFGSGHIMGTTRMGPKNASAGTAVVDPDCRCFDHPNLFVLGSSVFPTGSTANPTSTVAALALRAADTIEVQLRTDS